MAFGVIVTIIFGLILEKFVIRYLYGRPLDSVVATWGISLIVSQSFLVIFDLLTKDYRLLWVTFS